MFHDTKAGAANSRDEGRANGGRGVLAFYIISLGIAAGVVGSFIRHVFTQFGYVPGFLSGLYVTLGAAFLFSAAQLFYITILRAYQPTRSPAIYVCESLSQLTALLLFPALLDFPVPGLPDNLSRLAPLAYIGVAFAFHAVFKFMSFYAALSGAPDYDRPILVWFALSVLFGLFGVLGFTGWQRAIEAARVTADRPLVTAVVGKQYARARAVQEGAAFSGAMEGRNKPIMALRFANIEPELRTTDPIERVYATVTIEGRRTTVFQSSAALREDGWAEILVPTSFFPADAARYEVFWTRKPQPNWERIFGIRPIVYNLPERPGAPPPPASEVYLSGPSIYIDREAATGLSLLVIVVDGLATNHLSLFGYDRDATASIDRLGFRAHLFPKTIAPGANTDAGLAAIVTGRDPTALLGPETTPASLIDVVAQSGFATAAFVEVAEGEQFHDRAWASGFQVFEERTFPDPATQAADDSGETLSRVRQWISDHRQVPFLCLVRVGAVAALPGEGAPIEEVFGASGSAARDVDRFDSALLRLDRQLGALFKYIRDYETRSNTAIVVTSTYGLEFSPSATRRIIEERSEAVPLIIETPERRQLKYPNEAKLHDLAPTLARLAGVRLPGVSSESSLLP